MTYEQLIPPFLQDIVWLRIYINHREKMNCMNRVEIRESMEQYGGRTVRRVMPGYNFLIVWLEG